MTKALMHVLGLDDGSGPFYLFWSGFGADVTLFTAAGSWAWLWWRKHNCHVHRCWRIGRHAVEGTAHVVCHHHHPVGAPSHREVLESSR